MTHVPTSGIEMHHALGDPQTGAGEQVVGQRVAGETFEQASVSSTTPISQLISRGLRKAPVKNTRHMCTIMPP